MFVEQRKVVGATCLNASSPVIARRRFDYCIVDEASQITLPICLGPLRYAQTFVLVRQRTYYQPVTMNPLAFVCRAARVAFVLTHLYERWAITTNCRR